MGWKLTVLVFLFATWALSAGALIIGIPILLYLFYRLWSNREQKPVGLGRPRWMVYLGLFLLLLSLVAVAAHGTFSSIAFGASGLTLLVLALFPGAVQDITEMVGPATWFLRQSLGERKKEPESRPCVKLTQLPLDYLDSRNADPKKRLLRFQRLAQTLAEVGGVVELRLEFAGGSGKIMFSVAGRDDDERLRSLLRVVRSQLPEFGAELTTIPSAIDDSFSVTVEDVPEPSIDPVGPLARFFVENRLDGRYSVTISPARVNPVSRWLAGRRQRKLAESSGFQQVDDDRTTTVVDHPKQVELEESVKRLDRVLAKRPVRVLVRVSAPDKVVAMEAVGVLAGTLSGHRRINGLKAGRPQAPGRPGWRHSTMMLPSEAASYIWLPQASLGMKVVPSAEFQAPPASEGEVVLGEVVGLSGRNGQQVRIGRDELAKHIFISGMTGSGKTTSCFSLLLQLYRMRVPFLVVEPVKSEYRSLLAAIPELQVFTIGDDYTAPFRLNIFEPPPGVNVQTHLENLVAVWNASFVSYAPVPYVMEQVFAEVYRACGWDLVADTRGRPITFDDIIAQVERVVRGLGYEQKITMDVEAAIKIWLRSLTAGRKEKLFGAVSSTPLEALLERPTVVELKDIKRDEEKTFVTALLMMNLASYVQAGAETKGLRHFTLIEEAHRLLPNISTEKGDPESTDPRRMMVEQFGNMLAELRAYGEGLGVVEQIPTKILPDAMKNTATKVIHRIADLHDRKAVAGAMNATREQAAVLTALRPGEAVVSVEGHPVPVRVEVDDVVVKLGVPVGEVSDGEVKKRMAEFYLRNPLPEAWLKHPEDEIRMLVSSEKFGRELQEAYRLWIRTGEIGSLEELVLRSADRLARTGEDRVKEAARILSLGTVLHLPLDEEDRALFPRVVERDIRRSMKHGSIP